MAAASSTWRRKSRHHRSINAWRRNVSIGENQREGRRSAMAAKSGAGISRENRNQSAAKAAETAWQWRNGGGSKSIMAA